MPKPPMWTRTPCRTGSSAAQRSPFFATCQPTTSVTQWSTAPKNQHQPSTRVQNRAASVPHSSSGRSVRIRPPWLRSPRGTPLPNRRQQSVLPHEPQDPVLARPGPPGRQARSHLPVPLAQERALRQHRPDLRHQRLVAQRRLRTALAKLLPATGWRAQRVHARPWHPPRLAQQHQRIRPPR